MNKNYYHIGAVRPNTTRIAWVSLVWEEGNSTNVAFHERKENRHKILQEHVPLATEVLLTQGVIKIVIE